ncbi:hypothetical protein K505DRAFT_264204 [Melanomma pulvis-pyrius CBS 109.77]|uniref:Uncharacterized protein n=1 Tax=Melanomma pulvis-pyrius CBS 109.77 TaxID=1314802 RepID=A0A6A6XUY4_9PLEO|nr:hypothetical protein K505DRAFT_264204 [Melanomma pulvis-pyrius CBS 109.77]
MKLLSLTSVSCALAIATATPLVSSRDVKSAQTPNLGYDELLSLQHQFWNKFKYPNNIKEAESINSTVFSEDVQGRVSDTRNFVGRELNTEYIFGLFTPSDSASIIGRPGDYEIVQFVANKNIAVASTTVQFIFPSFNNISLPVRIDTWLTWNAAREISQYDVTFRWFGYLLKTLILGLNPDDPVKSQTAAVNSMAASICATHTTYCNGTNTQYESQDECYNFLTQDIRVGQSFELGMNTLLCRNVHEIMIKYRPDVHCSHIGKTGGGMCDDSISYETKVQEQYFTNSPWIPTQTAV